MLWDHQRSKSVSLKFIREFSSRLANEGPVSSFLNSLVEQERWLDVINHPLDYSSISVADAIGARQIQALFQKQDFIDLGIDTEAVAWEAFQKAEQKCLLTNRRFRNLDLPNGSVSSVLHIATRKISQILGALPDAGTLDFCFGPGANTSVKGDEANARVKLSSSLECSANFATSGMDLLKEVPLWVDGSRKISIAPGKVSFVPKSSKTKRPIIVGTILNGFFQKGYGTYIRERLRRFGCDLRDQSRNQRLARKGSIDGSLATIDLASASDTIARELVWHLLPYDWADRLNSLREEHVVYKGKRMRLEKFSSMGNAYTFELESLIFYALSLAASEVAGESLEFVSVYGDDIIVPTRAVSLLKETLDVCGFEVNASKSFVSGPFRESCGADYLHGIDIRPFYVRSRISDRTLFTMHNWFYRRLYFEHAEWIKSATHPPNRIYGPDGYGDGHLLGDHQLRRPRPVRRNGWGGGYFDTYVARPQRLTRRLAGDYILPAYSVYVRSGASSETDADIVRGVRGYSKISIYTLAPS